MRAMSESEFAKCECCGLVEECTAHYIERIRGGFCDRFICGLCAEAVKEEQCRSRLRSAGASSSSSMEDALRSHMAVCVQFNSEVRDNPAVHLASSSAAMRQLLSKRSGSSPSQGSTRT